MKKDKSKQLEEKKQPHEEMKDNFLQGKNIKDLIAPSGVDVSNIDQIQKDLLEASLFLLFLECVLSQNY